MRGVIRPSGDKNLNGFPLSRRALLGLVGAYALGFATDRLIANPDARISTIRSIQSSGIDQKLGSTLGAVGLGSTGSGSSFPGGIDLAAQLDQSGAHLAQVAGARWSRLAVSWNQIEPTPDSIIWNDLDALIAACRRDGLRVLATIRDNPTWAASTVGGPIDRVPLARFAAFVDRLVHRYAPRGVHDWEFYNEPDNTDPSRVYLGGAWGKAPGAYATMLRAVHPVVHAADPAGRVVIGGLAHDWFTGYDELSPTRPGPFARDFLDRVLAAGGGAAFDVFNFHYYPNFRPRWEPYGIDVIGKANHLRATLRAHGLTKPMICSEIGAWSDPHTPGGSEAWQASYVVQALVRGWAAGLEAVVWFDIADFGGQPLPHWGLFATDGTAKPAAHAYQTLREELAGTAYISPIDASIVRGGTVEGYRFHDVVAGIDVLALWQRLAVKQAPPFVAAFPNVSSDVEVIGRPHLVRDLSGQILAHRDDAGSFHVTVTPEPIFVEVERG